MFIIIHSRHVSPIQTKYNFTIVKNKYSKIVSDYNIIIRYEMFSDKQDFIQINKSE